MLAPVAVAGVVVVALALVLSVALRPWVAVADSAAVVLVFAVVGWCLWLRTTLVATLLRSLDLLGRRTLAADFVVDVVGRVHLQTHRFVVC